ncbi:MAG: hypothetical protein HFJ40_06175 [Clostridia bacterium]|nr:hypothetical protein [Clostridia bacterium]
MILLLILIILVLVIVFFVTKLKVKSIKISKKKLFIILTIIAVVVIALSALIPFINKHKYDNVKIEDNYYAVLSGGVGEMVNYTYLYMINGEYKYIQVQSNTTYWGSTEWVEKVTKVGKLTWPQEVIDVAKQNGSDGWVTINVDIPETKYQKGYNKGELITIEELRMLISID